jgi:hypothetical protein
MSREEDNKAIVGRWFTDFWGKTCNLGIVDELAAPDMLLQYSLHDPRRGREDIKAFMTDFRSAFPDLNFCGPDRRRRSCGWPLGGRWHPHRPGVQRLPGRLASRRNRPKDALHRNDRVAPEERQDRRGKRSRRRSDRAHPARPYQGGLTAAAVVHPRTTALLI